MTNRKLIAPRVSTPLGDTAHSSGSGVLPETLLSEQVQRLVIATMVGAALWAYGLLMDAIVRPLTVIAAVPWTNVNIEIAAMTVSGRTSASITRP